MKTTNNRIWIVLALVVALATAGGLAWRQKSRPAADGAAPGAVKGPDGKPLAALEFVPAEVTTPQRQAMPLRLEFSGPLVAPSSAVVRAKAGGTLLGLNVAEGSRVKAGQVLGQLDMADLGSRVAERAAMVESARATLAQAERAHAQNDRLAAQGFISGAALDGSRAAVQTARAQWQAAQASLATARVAMRDGALVSPIAGIVAKRQAVPGEKLSPDQQVLTVVDLARLELAGSVGTHEVSRLAPGMSVQVTVEGAAQPVAGTVARIAPAAEAGTRSIGVTVDVPNAGERLRAGQYAMAVVELADEVQRLTLPQAAVQDSAGQQQVWQIVDGRLQRRAVTLGRRDARASRVEVLDGVAASAVVLATRFDNLAEGQPAKVVAARAASSPLAAPAASSAAPASLPAAAR